jgi:membrane protease YdiL (CAAX protease family)
LPVSDSERRWWVLVSIAAGVCEEVVFRGFLMQFLEGQLHGGWRLDPTAAWLLSSLIFGCGHFYQGAAGIARTALAGLMFGLLAIVSGNLLLPIVLHVLVDMAVLWVYRPQLDNPDAAARLVQGCDPMLAIPKN